MLSTPGSVGWLSGGFQGQDEGPEKIKLNKQLPDLVGNIVKVCSCMKIKVL
jgi:hypothetical protein